MVWLRDGGAWDGPGSDEKKREVVLAVRSVIGEELGARILD
jgi:hypothetical protein